jgi:hypothetical protein
MSDEEFRFGALVVVVCLIGAVLIIAGAAVRRSFS